MKIYLLLHIMLLIYSIAGVFSKMAAEQYGLGIFFLACYASMLAALFIYAIGWQQVIKRLPLSVAFAHRPVTIIWGMVWGYLLFDEHITVTNIIGAIVIMIGIEIYSHAVEATPHE